MATGFTDFSEYTADAFPSDWTQFLDVDPTVVIADAAGLNGKLLRLMQADGDRFGSLLWDAIAADSGRDEGETLALVKAPGGFQEFYAGFGLTVQGSFDHGGIHGTRILYVATYPHAGWDTSDELLLARGAATDAINRLSPFPSTDDKIWMRLRWSETGEWVRAWFWADGDTPKTNADTPDLEITGITDLNGIVSAGLYRDGFDQDYALDCLYFSYGTSGDAAPSPVTDLPDTDSLIGHVVRRIGAA